MCVLVEHGCAYESPSLAELVPHLSGLTIEQTERDDSGIRIHARARASSATCRHCGNQSARIHSRYSRQLTDAAISGQPVQITLDVRRFFCDFVGCDARTFAEQISGLTKPYARRSTVLHGSGHPSVLVARTRERYAQVQELKAKGRSQAQISRELRLDPRTVHRYLSAAAAEDLLNRAVGRSDLLGPGLSPGAP